MADLSAVHQESWGFPDDLLQQLTSPSDETRPRTQGCDPGSNDLWPGLFGGHTVIDNPVNDTNRDPLDSSYGAVTERSQSHNPGDDSRSYIINPTNNYSKTTLTDTESFSNRNQYSTCDLQRLHSSDKDNCDVDTVHSQVCNNHLDSPNDDDGDVSEDEFSSSENQGDSPKRILRRHPTQNFGTLGTTWLDKDDTGDYDPEEEQRHARRKRRRITKQVKVHSARHTPITPQDHDHAEGQTTAHVTALKLRHATSKLAFAKLVKELEQSSKVEERPQRRLRAADVQRSRLHDIYHQHNLSDSLAGHPIQRGCYECAALAEKCSLLEDEREWPCQSCKATGCTDCDLITPPVRKLACQLCKRQRLPCSFTTSRNQGDSCHTCSQRGFRCVAGPVKEFIRPRIRYDRDWEIDPLPKPKTLDGSEACPECREAGRSCSLTLNNDGFSPCKECVDLNLPCTIGQLSTKHTTSTISTAKHDEKDHETSTSVVSNTKDMATKIPQLPAYTPDSSSATILTSFAHPLLFNVPDTDGNACHFCHAPDLAVFGLGRLRVSVIDTHNGSGWVETSGGHRAAGDVESTRMCNPCTTQRQQILTCAKHNMVRLSTVAPSRQDEAEALQALVNDQVQHLGRFCSLCPSLASYGCESGKGAEGDQEIGCGLKLCERCMVVLMGTHDGKLNKMLTHITHEPYEGRPFGFRADCELLREDGALMKYLVWMRQQREREEQ